MAPGRRLVSHATRRTLVIAVVAGFILGVVTQLGQMWLPEVLKPIANSISPWLAVAFAIGSMSRRPAVAAIAAWAALALALVGYYSMVWLQFGYGGSTSSLVLWGVAAVAGGLVFGPAGWFWRHGTPLVAAASIGVLAAVFIAEAIYIVRYLAEELRPASILYALAGIAVPLLLTRNNRQRLTAYAAVVPALVFAAGGYAVLIGLGAAVAAL